MDTVERALHFATIAHQGQTRRGIGNVPYITHCIGVKNILEKAGIQDETTLSAALLHDTLEDCEQVTSTQLFDQFGEEIKDRVLELTDEPEMSREERHRQQAERVAWMHEQSIMIKMADRIYNLRDFTNETPEMFRDGAGHRVKDYLRFTRTLKAAIGERTKNVSFEMMDAWDNLFEQLDEAIEVLQSVILGAEGNHSPNEFI